jgi:hypothetical protein
MARATIPKTRSGSGRQPAKPGRAKSSAAEVQPAVKAFKVVASGRRPAAKQAAPISAVSKDDLRARIEKLERANSTLRAKNKELRLAHVEAAEQLDELTLRLEAAERRVGRQARGESETPAGRGRGGAVSRRRRGSARGEDSGADEDGSDEMARSPESMAV